MIAPIGTRFYKSKNKLKNLLLIITAISFVGCGTIGVVQTKIEYTDGEKKLKITQPKNTSLSGMKYENGKFSVDKYASRADGNALQATEAIESMRMMQTRGTLDDLGQTGLAGYRSFLGQGGAVGGAPAVNYIPQPSNQPRLVEMPTALPSEPKQVPILITDSAIDAAIARYMKNQGKADEKTVAK